VTSVTGHSHFDVADRHFGRFTRTEAENAAALEAARAAARRASDPIEALEAQIALGEALTVARRDREAIGVLRPASAAARSEGVPPRVLGWALLALATAEHYADEPDAEGHFQEALAVARAEHDEVVEHYTLHHLGRFLVDTGRRAAAIDAFAACLVIRDRVGEARAEVTRRALGALGALGAPREDMEGRTGWPAPRPEETGYPVEGLVEWDAAWSRRYDVLASRLVAELGPDWTVEHIGSTSVPRLLAKPVIDLAVRLPEAARLADHTDAFARAGFSGPVDLGPHACFFLLDGSVRRAIAHVFTAADWPTAHQRLFAAWLREHPRDRDAYAALKSDLHASGVRGREYTSAKTAFVQDVVDRARAARGLGPTGIGDPS
jgi:GrpB-like predicted nucleotidyltransferase (UPF0157 family)